jgi:enamine deaminase RidA (YjgF/YER057c/UK114 family)
MTNRFARSGSLYEERYGFSRGVRIGNLVEIAGTAPIPPEGEQVAATAYEQMLRCGDIAVSALGELGATVDDVIRTRMFITDPGEANEIGRAHLQVFGSATPAATMVVVAALLEPEWKVEIEVEAVATT